ncbi:MAG: exodeoxyribonuclease VII large subunit [Chloroflexi bacterium]|nr:exodeoxyribonuclease VII large subunit [Chloroflexota bacterium]
MKKGFQSILFPPADDALSVTALSNMVQQALVEDGRFADVRVKGEIGTMTRPASGHLYFSLRDGDAILQCVIWKSKVAYVRPIPREGEMVVVRGTIKTYKAKSQYQMDANSLMLVGAGDLNAEFEELKNRLQAEGIFDQLRKRPIPQMPRVIGVVTSSTGAALHDVINVLSERWPLVELIVSPTLVQGDAAPAQIVAAIRRVEKQCDVILVARGGGSAEDLAAFNDERVVRAVATAVVPVVSGVGHEVDITLTDLAADLRAPTPSAGVAQMTPHIDDVRQSVDDVTESLEQTMDIRLTNLRRELYAMRNELRLLSPQQRLAMLHSQYAMLKMRLDQSVERVLTTRRDQLLLAQARLDALDPQAVLERGYAIVCRADGSLLHSVDDSRSGDSLVVRMHDGEFGVNRV